MFMLIDTPDPRYRPDGDGDGPGRPRVGVHTVLLLAASVACLYSARFTPAGVTYILLVGSFVSFLVAVLTLWIHREDPPTKEP
jgi:hypothetical protein